MPERRAYTKTARPEFVLLNLSIFYSSEDVILSFGKSVIEPKTAQPPPERSFPFHADLNQVEIWFGILSRKALRGASFKNIEALRQAIEEFVAAYNPTANPFRWRKREVRGSTLRNTIVN